jgi:hypothetical protein
MPFFVGGVGYMEQMVTLMFYHKSFLIYMKTYKKEKKNRR